ncbi:hypothetical protein PAMA_020705 [Pampus argenteus]
MTDYEGFQADQQHPGGIELPRIPCRTSDQELKEAAEHCGDTGTQRPKQPCGKWEVLSLLQNTTGLRVNVKKIANRDLQLSQAGTHCPYTLGWVSSQEQGLSLADLDEYSISRSTGPDDGFFHINGHSHKYSNPKGGSSSSGSSGS